MMLANAVGLNVPPVRIVRKEAQKVLLIKRYDRVLDNDILMRLHQEDFCQAIEQTSAYEQVSELNIHYINFGGNYKFLS